MIERRTLSVSLTPELDAFVAERVTAETGGSSSDVVHAGLRLLIEREGDGPSRRTERERLSRGSGA